MLLSDDEAHDLFTKIEEGLDPFSLPPGEAMEMVLELISEGVILSKVDYPKPQKLSPKSLCLIVSHACNMACTYCSLSKATVEGKLMSPETAIRAMKWLIDDAPGTKVDVDFFGGEPTLAWKTVKAAVDFSRKYSKTKNKTVRFSMSTNALGLTDEMLNYCDENYISLILSLDGPKAENDRCRVLKDGRPSFDAVLPNIMKVAQRRQRGWYVRGTYSKETINFSSSVIALHKMGINNLAFEPVVSNIPGVAFSEKDIPVIREEYEKLARYYVECKKAGIPIKFYHFEMDLDNGPCARKSAGGCGAGAEYLAVSPDEKIWPCHQFDTEKDFCLRTLDDPPTQAIYDEYTIKNHLTGKKECPDCWAAYLCSGGCIASNKLQEGDVLLPYKMGCLIQKIRLEAALWVYSELRE